MKIKLTASNFQKQYLMSLGPEMRQLAKPLFNIGIVHFSHTRIWNDQSVSAITTHPSYDELFMREHFYENAFAGTPEQYQSGIIFYDDLYIENEAITTLEDIKNSCIQHASFTPDLMIVEKGSEYVDLYWLGTPITFKNKHSFYINNLDYIKIFLNYFRLIAKKLLENIYKNQMIYPTKSIELTSLSSDDWQSKINLSSPLLCLAKLCKFTNQEMRVANLLLEGSMPKEISYHLNISSRTTEKHIAKLKQKTNSRSLIQLISILNYRNKTWN